MIFSIRLIVCVWVCGLLWPAHAVLTGDEWEVLENVELIENKNNDGDSFRVCWGEKEFTVRLYFVDAPESVPGLRERVEEQADYFGITPEQAVEVGRVASGFVRSMLKEEDFTITTRWQNYPGRVYVFVTAGGRDLGELLVENGLGRIHGQTVRGLTGPVKAKLAELEAEAKKEHRGAWAYGEKVVE